MKHKEKVENRTICTRTVLCIYSTSKCAKLIKNVLNLSSNSLLCKAVINICSRIN